MNLQIELELAELRAELADVTKDRDARRERKTLCGELQAEVAQLRAELMEAQDYVARAATGAVDRSRLPLTQREWVTRYEMAEAERDALAVRLEYTTTELDECDKRANRLES